MVAFSSCVLVLFCLIYISQPTDIQFDKQLSMISIYMLNNAQNSPSQALAICNRELPDVQAGFRKGRGTRDKIANIRWIIEKARDIQKNIYFCFIDYAKAFDCVDHNKLWKILKEMGIPDNLTCLLRNLYAGQEATVRTGHGTTHWFQIGKGVRQACTELSLSILSFMDWKNQCSENEYTTQSNL